MSESTTQSELLHSLIKGLGTAEKLDTGTEIDLRGGWLLIKDGSLRSLAALPPSQQWCTVQRHRDGELVGWLNWLHQRPIEVLRAAEPTTVWHLSAEAVDELWGKTPELEQFCAKQTPAIEAVHLLQQLSHANQERAKQLEQWKRLMPQLRWLVDVNPTPADLEAPGQWYWPDGTPWGSDTQPSSRHQRLIWLPDPRLQREQALVKAEMGQLVAAAAEQARSTTVTPEFFELPRASGPRDIPLAICQAIALHMGVPFNRDNLLDQINAVLERQPQLNLFNIGQLISSLDLSASLSQIPMGQLARVPTPAVLEHQGHFAVLEGIEPDGRLRLLEPELGPLLVPPTALIAPGAERMQLLLFRRRPGSKERRFSWSWYGPYLAPHRQELIQVLACTAITTVLGLVIGLGIFRMVQAQGGGTDSINGVISIGIILIAACVMEAVVSVLRSLIFTGVANRVDMDTRETILDRMVRLPQGFFDERPVGQITYYFTKLDQLRDFLISKALTSILDFGFSFFFLVVLWWISPTLTLITLSSLPLFIVLAFIANPLIDDQIGRTVQEAISTNSYLTEAITGIQTIKSQNAELKTRWQFQDRYSRYIGEDFKLKVSSETIGALAKFISELTQIALMVVGIYLISKGELSIGALFAFRILGGRVTGPMIQLVQTWQQFKIQSRNLQLAADVVDRPTEQSALQASNIPMPPIAGNVSIQSVDFSYSSGGPQILHNVSLEVPRGTFVGMVGGSGSGKSTILKLLPRFYEPDAGRLLIDGMDINKVELYSLRRQIGVVPQDSLLFDGTIKDNLLMVKPDASADELIRAAKVACAHEFIMAMPQGYNSSVGERGAGLSGGQRQRMALARAVLQNPRMLILDEATSALDARTERQVCMNLFEAFRGRTVFFITHRLSTVRPADMIVLMDQGAVMEVGTHKALMEQEGWYYALYQSQSEEGLS
ncbi:ABC transporter transmembrane domain-containing protein [Synechococcus sp. RS9902]|uniref:ABC transporter transmembrane domain-containing protein n=1 Tax=Synechococcus sp. RS9902 TaxID=221345 RepID=UPI002102F75C|nr:ABC transporter transmembrane domain-containing protein [Synechococcus sp. RS9902]